MSIELFTADELFDELARRNVAVLLITLSEPKEQDAGYNIPRIYYSGGLAQCIGLAQSFVFSGCQKLTSTLQHREPPP